LSVLFSLGLTPLVEPKILKLLITWHKLSSKLGRRLGLKVGFEELRLESKFLNCGLCFYWRIFKIKDKIFKFWQNQTSVAEFKEFERRFRLKPWFKYGRFKPGFGGFKPRLKFFKFHLWFMCVKTKQNGLVSAGLFFIRYIYL